MSSCHSSTCQLHTSCDLTVALVGNPNCGKTTLFNALTGAKQRIGNWPGVTVERKSGSFCAGAQQIEVVDLPGIYSLSLDSGAIDEKIACEYIQANKSTIIVNIVDASNLERHLYLTLQLLEMGAPVIIALNMMDIAQARYIHIDIKKLEQILGCKVIELTANKNLGIQQLKQVITSKLSRTQLPAQFKDFISTENNEDADILLADARYKFIDYVLSIALTQSKLRKTTWTMRIDNIVLNRVLGIPIFLAVMYSLFFFAINIGGAFQDFFDIGSETIFVNGLAHLLQQMHMPMWVIALLADGVGKGINTVVTFIPVIGAMFLFLAMLEDSGYMARAAFVVDRFMRLLGLPGKAFVPMIVGFGCNVPAIMGARTLENKSDRILTIMMTPFMSCGARLAIFAVFTAAFFPRGGQNIIFALYMIGIFMAVLTGFLLRKTLLKGDPSPLVMELPAYHIPHLRTIFLHAWQRLKGFVYRAGKLIVPICILIGALNSMYVGSHSISLLSLVGQWMTPLFSPMGLHSNNWPATVGLVTGVLAKEVVVGTLNTLYTQMGHLAAQGGDNFQLMAGLKAAWQSIGENFSQLGDAFTNPVYAQAPIDTVNQGVYGLMYQKFDGQVGAFAYLLFVLLYFPCVSTVAVMLRELHKGWGIFSMIWMTAVAYGAAVFFYQAATWFQHPISSSLWLIAVTSLFFGTIFSMRSFANRHEGDYKWAY